MRYFQLSEFDSPDAPGSGAKMDKEFLALLDEARHIAGVPFKVNSGYRTQAHHNSLTKRGFKTAKNSAHLRGFAADIHAPDSRTRYAIVQALNARGVIGDFRAGGVGEPDILRFGITPLYLGFADIWNAVEQLKQLLESSAWREARFARKAAVT